LSWAVVKVAIGKASEVPLVLWVINVFAILALALGH
jgi:hypothetical protein